MKWSTDNLKNGWKYSLYSAMKREFLQTVEFILQKNVFFLSTYYRIIEVKFDEDCVILITIANIILERKYISIII